jgi:tRNA pseudouridine38-40 synthase
LRIALGLEYDGTAYNGWQRQRTGIGVQERVESALQIVADEAIEVVCAGRTDTGVHASGQVVHFDTSSERTQARFSASSSSYEYRRVNRLDRSALYRHGAWWVYAAIDPERMHRAAQALVGRHDFSAYRAAGCQASTATRDITSLSVTRDKDWVRLQVTANAFLQHMVRNITGTLVTIGCGDESEEWAAEVLQGRDRKKGGAAAPPHGLTLVNVGYPNEFELPPNPHFK